MGYYINSKGEKINVSEHKTEHLEGKILLLNGSELTCYEKQDVVNDKIGEEEKKRLCKLFTDNAFYLLAHRDRILSDSRMFLCQIAVKSGLMYSGTSGFQNPTLGVYLEWWRECPNAMITDKDGTRSLIFYLAGSPLSGANWSKRVDESGDIHNVRPSYPFISQWRSFIGINTRYTDAKRRYQAYSLEEVLKILHAEDGDNTNHAQAIAIQFLEGMVKRIDNKAKALASSNEVVNEKYKALLFKVYGERLCRIYNQYKENALRFNSDIDSVKELRRTLKANLRTGAITLKDYEPQRKDITCQLNELNHQLSNAEQDCLKKICQVTGEKFYSIVDIENFITKYNKNSNE